MPHNSKIGIVSRIIRYVYVMLHYVLIMDFCVVALEQPMVGFKEIAVLAACMMISYFMRERLTRIIGIIIGAVYMGTGKPKAGEAMIAVGILTGVIASVIIYIMTSMPA